MRRTVPKQHGECGQAVVDGTWLPHHPVKIDREFVEQITENPYLQYFIGLPGYQEEAPFDASTLVDFRRQITAEMLIEANEYLLGA